MSLQQRLLKLEALGAARDADNGMVEREFAPDSRALLAEVLQGLDSAPLPERIVGPVRPLSQAARQHLADVADDLREWRERNSLR